MKKLIAMFTAFLFSAFSGVAYTPPKEDMFYYGDAAYFQVPGEEGTVLYKQLYQSVYGSLDNPTERCDTTRVTESRKKWELVNDHTSADFSTLLWDPVYVTGDVTISTTDDTVTYTLSSECNIFAPTNGEIVTSHYASDYGHKMDFKSVLSDGTVYLTRIENAKCWYCCAKKTVPEDGRYTATAGTMQGQTMRAGDMLCVGQEGTTVTIIRNPKS